MRIGSFVPLYLAGKLSLVMVRLIIASSCGRSVRRSARASVLSWLLSMRKGDAGAELQMAMPLPSALTAENLSMKAPGKSSREAGSTWSGTWVVVIDFLKDFFCL